MRCDEINIRDPFILNENGKYYLYGTRAAHFGIKTNGFDVYTSNDLIEWSEPHECFNSNEHGLNTEVNWAPEVHKYKGLYYMLATFTKPNNLRGTYILRADNPMGPFVPHSEGAVTPYEWESLDGTLYIEDEKPYIVFCHEHTQIIDGTVCYAELSDDLTKRISEPVTLFSGSSPSWADRKPEGEHYTTDGPFMFRTKDKTLLMIWSTFIGHTYIEALVRFKDGKINDNFEHLSPIITDDGGHGMIFEADDKLYLTFHSPNQTDYERVKLTQICDKGDTIAVK
ncbi:MAG: family 43 glycosylhydrolase [Eubacterium sp.]|nr:family 43 glycosylhydrolase [Eubacterium sp.]